jgi:hypothetical protein
MSLLLLFVTVVLSCSPKIFYSGTAYMPTRNVTVYLDESALPKNIITMGKGTVKKGTTLKPESLQAKAVAKAKEKGADAVLIRDYRLPEAHSGINGRFRRDSVSRNIRTAGKGQANVPSEIIILFLKYK